MTEEKKSLKKWLENFWYYYKFHTIIILFLAFAMTIAVAQCAGRENTDYSIVLATQSGIFTDRQIGLIEDAFAKYGEDLNGDGKVTVGVSDCSYSQTKSDYEMQKVKRQKLQLAVMSDWKSQIYITDETSFSYIDGLSDEGFLVDLKLPDDSGKSFILTNTDLLKTIEKESGSNLPNELRVSRRIVNNTMIEKNKGVVTMQQSCDKMLNALVKANQK